MLRPKLLDTATGRTAWAEDMQSSLYWWSDGNGSCDCNRAIALGEDVYADIAKGYEENCCFGSRRIIAIDVDGDLEGHTKEQALNLINQHYEEWLK